MFIRLHVTQLVLLVLTCLSAGMSIVLAADALDAGRSPLPSAAAAVCALVVAALVLRDAAQRSRAA